MSFRPAVRDPSAQWRKTPTPTVSQLPQYQKGARVEKTKERASPEPPARMVSVLLVRPVGPWGQPVGLAVLLAVLTHYV